MRICLKIFLLEQTERPGGAHLPSQDVYNGGDSSGVVVLAAEETAQQGEVAILAMDQRQVSFCFN